MQPKIMAAAVLAAHGHQAFCQSIMGRCSGNISSAVGPYANLRYDGAHWSRWNVAFLGGDHPLEIQFGHQSQNNFLVYVRVFF